MLEDRAPERCGFDDESSVVEMHDGLDTTLTAEEPGMDHVSQSTMRRLEPHRSRVENRGVQIEKLRKQCAVPRIRCVHVGRLAVPQSLLHGPVRELGGGQAAADRGGWAALRPWSDGPPETP